MRRTTAGFLVIVSGFAVIVALTASGASAESDPKAAPSEQAVSECSASQPANVQIQAAIERLRYEQTIQASPEQARDVIVLNNRGYNYGANPDLEPDRVGAEAPSPGH
jgi:hypothetical protein